MDVNDYNLLGKPYVRDISSIYSFGEQVHRDRDEIRVGRVCTEKITGMIYKCMSYDKREMKKKYSQSQFEKLRGKIEMWEHLKGHPNIFQLKGAYEDSYNLYLVSDYLESESKSLAETDYYFPHKVNNMVREEAEPYVFWQIMNAINTCHSMGVMYRFLDTATCHFVNNDVDLYLINLLSFEEAVFIEEGTIYKDVVGEYKHGRAPEMNGKRSYGKEIDVWSAGILLVFIVTGKEKTRSGAYWRDLSQHDIYEEIAEQDVSLSETVEDLMRKILDKDPRKRITAAQVLEHPWLKGLDPWLMLKFTVKKTKRFPPMIKLFGKEVSEEENQRLRKFLNNMDTYANTTTTLEELKNVLSTSASKLSELHMTLLMNAAEEYFTEMRNRQQVEIKKCHKAFQYLDKNRDGFITRDELSKIMSPYGFADETSTDQIIDDADIDKDGKISYEDFEVMIKKELDFGEKKF